jgi:hypothetical protein
MLAPWEGLRELTAAQGRGELPVRGPRNSVCHGLLFVKSKPLYRKIMKKLSYGI